MSVIVLLIVAGGLVAAGFLLAFVWAVRTGQFDDTHTPAVRMLLDDADGRFPTPNGQLPERGDGTGGVSDSGRGPGKLEVRS